MPYVAQVEIEVRVPISQPFGTGLFDTLPGIPQIFHVGDTIPDITVFASGDLATLVANSQIVIV